MRVSLPQCQVALELTSALLRIIVLNAWIFLLYALGQLWIICSSITFSSLITSSTNGYDGSMMNGLQSLTQWTTYFNNPSGGRLGLLNAIQACLLFPPPPSKCWHGAGQNIGGLAAYPISPYVSDGLGRRSAILLGATIMCIATAIQTAAQSTGMFIGARCVLQYFCRDGGLRKQSFQFLDWFWPYLC